MKVEVNLKAFEEAVQKITEKYMIPGTSVAITQDGEIFYHKGFGFRNVNDSLPITEDTVFGIGSITKSFSCVAIMQLQEAGKLNVLDSVIKYLPEFKVKNEEALKHITIHHFMTHSSGLPPMSSLSYAMKKSMDFDPSVKNYPGLNIDLEDREPIDTYEQLMKFIAEQDFELLGAPGTHFSYSNDAYALLGTIIERISGKSYEQYIYDHILIPCGMENSFFMIEEYGEYENITTCYAEDRSDGTKRIVAAPIWWDAPSMRAAGFLKSTSRDMLMYAEIFRNAGVVNGKRILSEESVKEMVKPHIQAQPGRFYGYGLMITPDYFGTTLVEHGGGLKAISAQLSILPEKGVSGVVLTNLAGVPAARVMQLAFNAYGGRAVDASHLSFEKYDIAEERLEQYQGEYQSNEGMKVSIKIKNGKPVLLSQNIEIPITFVKENIFIANVNDSTEIAEILVNDNSEPYGISYHFRQFPKVVIKLST
ncbi:serine hydrolase [Peribacillus simplex]|uniref:serine hydrolase domain-containing protein n=1 Tax=Peribacillus simplex TaxID=1478 RepID=UPI002E20C5A1|nr:serine hydrolase [Peribacillus simplex]